MKYKIIITKELDDSIWGISDLLDGRKLEDAKDEIIELLNEDWLAVIDDAYYNIQAIAPTGDKNK